MVDAFIQTHSILFCGRGGEPFAHNRVRARAMGRGDPAPSPSIRGLELAANSRPMNLPNYDDIPALARAACSSSVLQSLQAVNACRFYPWQVSVAGPGGQDKVLVERSPV
jgi:hypothetical protein